MRPLTASLAFGVYRISVSCLLGRCGRAISDARAKAAGGSDVISVAAPAFVSQAQVYVARDSR